MAGFNYGNSSDDDFQTSKSPLLSQNYVKKNQKIPVGHILAAMKWKNTPVAQKMLETIKVIYSSDLGIVDFHPSGDCAVIYISSAELVEGQQYRKRLVQLKAVKGIRKMVISERTHNFLSQFSALQHFVVIELELDLIPITENSLHSILIHMVSAENKIAKNPFIQPWVSPENTKFDHIAAALKNVPKIGDKKIACLVEKFGSLQNISKATVEELTGLLGSAALAKSVWEYFN